MLTTRESEITPKNLPTVSSQHEAVSSAYAGHLAAAKTRKTNSRAGSKASSKASSTAKLQLKLEEAEIQVKTQYNLERDQRSQRLLARNTAKVREQQRREEEEKKQRQRREEEDQKQRLDDEREEREVELKMKMASLRARRLVIEEHEETQLERIGSLGIAEVDPTVKTAVFVASLPEVTVQTASFEKRAAEKLSPVATKSLAANIDNRKGKYAGVNGAAKTHERKPEISVPTLKFEQFPLPTYTTPVMETLSTWAPQPAPDFSVKPKLAHKLEPPIYKQTTETIDIKTDKLHFSTPLTHHESLNPRTFIPPFAPLGDRSAVKPMFPAHAQNDLQRSTTAESNNADRIVETVCAQMALSRLPLREPDAFDGSDFLQFPLWRMRFESLINRGAMSPVDKLDLLVRCVKGEARLAIQGYLYLPPDRAFDKAYGLIIDRYGDSFHVIGAFKDRLKSWPRIAGTDIMGLRSFVDYLKQCETVKESYQGLRTLDDESENAEMIKKLPLWLSRQWTRKVAVLRRATGEYPSFSDFVEFLSEEDSIAHDPLARTLQKSEAAKAKRTGTSFASDSRTEVPIPGGANGKSFGTCYFCGEKHSIQVCEKFASQTFDYRQQYTRNHQLCFGCLVRGHVVRDCKNKRVCKRCQGGHPTSMHKSEHIHENSPSAVPITACASNSSSFTPQKSSMVLPVRISHIANPENGKIVYAMLDSQSDCTFITDSTARSLGLQGTDTR